LRKQIIDVPPLACEVILGYKFPHFLIIDDAGNRRWRRRR
jgi:hypothetical protein